MPKNRYQSWDKRRKRWLGYVRKTLKTLDFGRSIPVGPSAKPLIAPSLASSSVEGATVLVASPHPDDEALIGALPLRLRLESGVRVVNCALTLGRDLSERPRRWTEVQASCRALDFELIAPGESGFNDVTLENRQGHPEQWREKVEALRRIFDQESPDAVLAPHAEDFNTIHIGTHHLVVDAIGEHLDRCRRGPILLIETEFWHEHSRPNLMIGVSSEVLAIQIMATAEHGGEVSRNPYHLSLPARMVDNVRRGSEVVGGQGAAAQPCSFAELYRVTFMKGSKYIEPRPGGLFVPVERRIDLKGLQTTFWPENT